MPAKRALKLDSFIMGKVPATPQVSSKKNHQSYSPTTGTCLMSPFSSPRSNNIQEQRNGLSKGKRDVPKGLAMKSSRKGQPQIEESDRLSVLQSKVEDSLETFMQIRQNLTSLQALEGTRELENIIGALDNSGHLKNEVRKTKKLLEQARKQKLLKRSSVRHPAQGISGLTLDLSLRTSESPGIMSGWFCMFGVTGTMVPTHTRKEPTFFCNKFVFNGHEDWSPIESMK
nr:centromere protein R isoform X3 [Pogona vitticeps]